MKRRTYRWDTGLRVRVLGLVVFLLTLVAGLGATLSLTYRHVDDLQQKAERTRENVALMGQVTGDFAEMTSALRGFLLAGHEAFLQPYGAARERLDLGLTLLGASAAGDSRQMARLERINQLVDDWQTRVADPEISAKRVGRPDAGQIVAGGSGLNHITEVRNLGGEFIRVEASRYDQEVASAREAATGMQRITWAGVGIASLLTLFGFVIFARSVTRATDALATAAKRLAAGERGIQVEATLDGELQEVALAFSSMSTTLAAQEEELIAQNEQLHFQQQELQTRTRALERRDAQLSRLNRMGAAMIGTLEIEPLSHLVLEEYLDLYGGIAGALLTAGEQTGRMYVQVERWLAPGTAETPIPLAGPLARCVERCEVVVARLPEAISRVPIWPKEAPVNQEVYVPLVLAGRVLAVVVIACSERISVSDEAQLIGNSLAPQAAVALAAALSHLDVKQGLLALQEQASRVEELNAQLEEERDRASAQLGIYLSVVSTMQAGAWLTDTGGNLLVVNSTFSKYFGDVPPEVGFDTVLSLLEAVLAPQDPFLASARALVESLDDTGGGTVQLLTGHVLQWASAPVGPPEDPIGRLFTFQDVTELTRLDRLKSEFVSTVSHELRTPLTSIMGYLNVVTSGQVGELNPMQKEFLEVVSRNTTRLALLINDLLDIQRIESGKGPLQLAPVSVGSVVQQVADTFRVAAHQKGLAFTVQVPPEGDSLVLGDRDRLTQIASNLLNNAVKYTREGHVSVSVQTLPEAVTLTVEDTGIGISKADQERIFEKFFRGEDLYVREAGGTGLGLSIVKALAEDHGGRIQVQSEPGNGSRFTLLLPPLRRQGERETESWKEQGRL